MIDVFIAKLRARHELSAGEEDALRGMRWSTREYERNQVMVRSGHELEHSMLLLSGAYEGVKAQAWLENWQGLKHAIETRQQIEIEHFRNEAISQDPYWLHSGKR